MGRQHGSIAPADRALPHGRGRGFESLSIQNFKRQCFGRPNVLDGDVYRQHDAGYAAPLKQLVPREPHKMLGLMPASVQSAVVMEFEEQLIVFRISIYTRSSTGQSTWLRTRGLGVRVPPGVPPKFQWRNKLHSFKLSQSRVGDDLNWQKRIKE